MRSIKNSLGCFVLTGWAATAWANLACSAVNMAAKGERVGPIGSPENWRCVVFEKLRRVELVNDSWRTAPNHSRPATCVVEADIDAEDQPERDPQKGH